MTNVGPDDLLKRVASLKTGSARKPATVTESAALAFQRKPSYAGASSLLAAISAESGVRTHRPLFFADATGCYSSAKALQDSRLMRPLYKSGSSRG
jgi:hypothetical protein